jgi:aspartokinase
MESTEADPFKVPAARKFETVSYLEALNRRLQVMDSTALSLCMENSLPIVVFDLRLPRSIVQVVAGEHAAPGSAISRRCLRKKPAAASYNTRSQRMVQEQLQDARTRMEKAVDSLPPRVGQCTHRPRQPRPRGAPAR